MINIKKILVGAVSLTLILSTLTGCGNNKDKSVAEMDISVITREDGSGTRGAFVELTGVEEKNSEGKKIDNTIKDAITAQGTDVVLNQVKSNNAAIGYISLGSLNDTVKALKVEGVQASAENINNGTYKIARPFNIATKGTVSEVAQDFINYILSKEGQELANKKYVAVNASAKSYNGTKPSGKVTVSGSTSVGPLMEQLAESYMKVNPNADVQVQQSDSTSGMQDAIKGTVDIGMASRELKDTEKQELKPTVIAMDGIALIVNKENELNDITIDMIKKIYTGKVTEWSEVK